MSMANSLELRVPFLDRKVFELACRIPLSTRSTPARPRSPCAAQRKRTIPARTADKKKLGFPVPVRAWLRDETYAARVREAFNAPAAAEFFNVKELNRMLDQHMSGKRGQLAADLVCVHLPGLVR